MPGSSPVSIRTDGSAATYIMYIMIMSCSLHLRAHVRTFSTASSEKSPAVTIIGESGEVVFVAPSRGRSQGMVKLKPAAANVAGSPLIMERMPSRRSRTAGVSDVGSARTRSAHGIHTTTLSAATVMRGFRIDTMASSRLREQLDRTLPSGLR